MAKTAEYEALVRLASRLNSFRRDDLNEIASELLNIRNLLHQQVAETAETAASKTSDQLFKQLHRQINDINADQPARRPEYSNDIERMLKLQTKVEAIEEQAEHRKRKRAGAARQGDTWHPGAYSETTLADVHTVLLTIADHQRSQSTSLAQIAANAERGARGEP